MSEVQASSTMARCSCGKETKAKANKAGDDIKVPRGWNRLATNELICKDCIKTRFMPRSIRLRIIGPTDTESRDTKEMYKALNAASVESNKFANWYLQKLLAADLVQTKVIEGLELSKKTGKPTLPPTPQVEWYAEATKMFSHCAPTSLVQQARMVASYYGKERFAALVAMNKNVRSYRWDGLPVVVNAQSWKLVAIENDSIVLRTQIGPGKSWSLKVFAQGENLARIRQLVNGDAEAGAAVFVRRAREPRPGEAKRVRVWYLRISDLVPKKTAAKRNNLKEVTLTLGHDAESLLYGVLDDGEDVFEYTGVELRKSVVKFQRLDRRRQIDNSFRQQGWSRRKYNRWAKDRTAACEKRNNKTKNEIALAAASLARWCESHKVTAVDFDRTPRGFLDSFPWRALHDKIVCALQNIGIAIHVMSDDPVTNQEQSQVGFVGPGCETNGMLDMPSTSPQA